MVLTMVSRVELRDVKANKVIWANPDMQFSETYECHALRQPRRRRQRLPHRNDANALDRLASEFARAVVSAMLEAVLMPALSVAAVRKQIAQRRPDPIYLIRRRRRRGDVAAWPPMSQRWSTTSCRAFNVERVYATGSHR